MRVPPTPGAKLKKMVQKALDTHQGPQGTRGTVDEVGTITIRSMFAKSDPFPRQRCGRPECPLGGACRPASTTGPAAAAPGSTPGSAGDNTSTSGAGSLGPEEPAAEQSSQPGATRTLPHRARMAVFGGSSRVRLPADHHVGGDNESSTAAGPSVPPPQDTTTTATTTSVPAQQHHQHPILQKQGEKGCRGACYLQHHNYEWYCVRCDLAIMQQHQQQQHQHQQHQRPPPPLRPVYKGESSRSPLTRASQHLELYDRQRGNSSTGNNNNNNSSSWMWEHTEGVHGGEVGGHSDFVLVVTGTDRDCVRRVLWEAARLKHA